jgi:hypothetical protein
MTSNFILYQNYAIHYNDKHLDLHNNFDFMGFNFDSIKRELNLYWIGAEGKWVPEDNPSKLIIAINDVEYLKILPREDSVPFTEYSCLSDLTYYLSSERDEDECVYYQEKPTSADDIIFKFQSQQIIRAKGSNVNVYIE